MADDAEATLRKAQAFFGDKAEAYRTSDAHRDEDELARMTRLLAPPRGGRALDVATGGGHTAVALARAGCEVVAADATPAMLGAAERSAREARVRLAGRVACDAHRMPFADGSFDVVASRIAPHHFTDLGAFVAESARLLRTGGALYVFDLTTPEGDERAADVINRIERLRDPSHVDSYAPGRWRAALADTGLVIAHFSETASEKDLEAWLTRAKMPPERDAEARRLLAEMRGKLGGYGVTGAGKMRLLRVEFVARKA